MSNIGGGGALNVGKPVEYYKIIDSNKIDSAKKTSASTSSKFNKILESQRGANTASVKKNNFTNSKITRAQNALEMQIAREKASVKPTRDDMDSLISASGLTNDQINQLIGTGQSGKLKGVNKPSGLPDDKIGTNLALKKLAKEMEIQIMGMFFTLMDNARETNPEGGFGEQIFRSQYLTEIVKDSSSTELGEIGIAIYRNLVKEDNIKEAQDVRK